MNDYARAALEALIWVLNMPEDCDDTTKTAYTSRRTRCPRPGWVSWGTSGTPTRPVPAKPGVRIRTTKGKLIFKKYGIEVVEETRSKTPRRAETVNA